MLVSRISPIEAEKTALNIKRKITFSRSLLKRCFFGYFSRAKEDLKREKGERISNIEQGISNDEVRKRMNLEVRMQN